MRPFVVLALCVGGCAPESLQPGNDAPDALDGGVDLPPTLASVAISPDPPTDRDTFTCVPSGFSDDLGAPPQYDFRWLVDDAEVGDSDALAPTEFMVGSVVQCFATPFDGTQRGREVASARLTVAAGANSPPSRPEVTLVPAFPTSVEDLQVVITSPSVDPDGDPITYEFAWRRDGQAYLDQVGVAGPSTLDATHTLAGDRFSVTVIPHDGRTVGPSGKAEVWIRNAPPTLGSVMITPVAPTSSDPMVAYWTGWADADDDPDSSQVEWRVNGTVVQSGPTFLPRGLARRGDVVEVTVQAFDGEDFGPSASAGPVVVGNSPPTAPLVDLTPVSPLVADDMLCGVVRAPTDVDGDPVSYEVSFYADRPIDPFAPQPWTTNRVLLQQQTATSTQGTAWTLPASATSYGDAVYCEVRGSDGQALGPAGASARSTVGEADDVPAPRLVAVEPTTNGAEVRLSGDFVAGCGGVWIECRDALGFDVTPVGGEPVSSSTLSFHTALYIAGAGPVACEARCQRAPGTTSLRTPPTTLQSCPAGVDPAPDWETVELGTVPAAGAPIVVDGTLPLRDEDRFRVSVRPTLTVQGSHFVDTTHVEVRIESVGSVFDLLLLVERVGVPGVLPCSLGVDGVTTCTYDGVGDCMPDGSFGLPICTRPVDWYLEVRRADGQPKDCTPYTLTVSW